MNYRWLLKKSLRVLLITLGCLLALVVLIVGVTASISWYRFQEDFDYTWDATVENTTGVSTNLYNTDGIHRGVAVKGLGAADFSAAVRSNVEWVSLTQFGWQSELNSPEVDTYGTRPWAPTNEEFLNAVAAARDVGLRVVIKPHLWVTGGGWRSKIRMNTDEEWASWFQYYGAFILHHAQLADSMGAEMLCIGTELHGTVERDVEWRDLITKVRSVYDGQLIYAANWDGEFEAVSFWDALDAIGIQAYFPLTETQVPQVSELEAAWAPHIKRIHAIAKRYDRRVILTEVGYRSVPDAGERPWDWGGFLFVDRVSKETQMQCYEALFRTFWDQPWFGGMYMWVWYPHPGTDLDILTQSFWGRDFTPQGKPAENVMARWFGRGHEAVPRR